ncbi:MAG: hypothetical protein ABJH33_22605 [Rhizobiaceae bacterium]
MATVCVRFMNSPITRGFRLDFRAQIAVSSQADASGGPNILLCAHAGGFAAAPHYMNWGGASAPDGSSPPRRRRLAVSPPPPPSGAGCASPRETIVETDYNFWADLLTTYRSNPDWLKFCWLVIPALLLYATGRGLTHLLTLNLLRRRRRQRRERRRRELPREHPAGDHYVAVDEQGVPYLEHVATMPRLPNAEAG